MSFLHLSEHPAVDSHLSEDPVSVSSVLSAPRRQLLVTDNIFNSTLNLVCLDFVKTYILKKGTSPIRPSDLSRPLEKHILKKEILEKNILKKLTLGKLVSLCRNHPSCVATDHHHYPYHKRQRKADANVSRMSGENQASLCRSHPLLVATDHQYAYHERHVKAVARVSCMNQD